MIADARRCAKDGVKFEDEKKHYPRTMLVAIPLDSPLARIISEAMEDGNGIRRAHADVMDCLRCRNNGGELNVLWWGLSSTYSCFLRMSPTVTVVQKRAQGSDDPQSAWCQACMAWEPSCSSGPSNSSPRSGAAR